MSQSRAGGQTTECRLCGARAKRVESHIYPRAFAKEIGGPTDPPRQFETGTWAKRLRTGWHDYIVCHACEERFKPWDDYGIRFLRRPLPTYTKSHPLVLIRDVDYVRLKLFCISTLWRAAVSSLPALSQVSLGVREPALRTLLLNGDPGATNTFAVLIDRSINRPGEGLMLPPRPVKAQPGAIRAYRMCYGGHEIVVKSDSRPFPKGFRARQLRPGHPVTVNLLDFRQSAEAATLREYFDADG